MTTETWKEQCERQKQLWSEIKALEPMLKFGRRYVIPSDISSQFYDEKKLEQEYLKGRTETIEMLQGTEGHERIVEDYRKVPYDEIWRSIYAQNECKVAEMVLIARYKDIE